MKAVWPDGLGSVCMGTGHTAGEWNHGECLKGEAEKRPREGVAGGRKGPESRTGGRSQAGCPPRRGFPRWHLCPSGTCGCQGAWSDSHLPHPAPSRKPAEQPAPSTGLRERRHCPSSAHMASAPRSTGYWWGPRLAGRLSTWRLGLLPLQGATLLCARCWQPREASLTGGMVRSCSRLGWEGRTGSQEFGLA